MRHFPQKQRPIREYRSLPASTKGTILRQKSLGNALAHDAFVGVRCKSSWYCSSIAVFCEAQSSMVGVGEARLVIATSRRLVSKLEETCSVRGAWPSPNETKTKSSPDVAVAGSIPSRDPRLHGPFGRASPRSSEVTKGFEGFRPIS